MKNVVPNATMEVLRELTGDGAARQALWVKGYLSTSDRIKPEKADLMLNTDAKYEQLAADSLAILKQIIPMSGIGLIVEGAACHQDAFEALAKEVFSQAMKLPTKGVDLQLVCEALSKLGEPSVNTVEIENRAAFAGYLVEQAQLAYDELMTSLKDTVERGAGNNPAYTHSAARREGEVGTYETLGQGIKVHLDTGDLHVQGLEVNRVVTEPGVYKVVKSKAKTLAKEAFRRQLPLSKWRQLVLRRGKFEMVLIRDRCFGPTDFAPPEE